MANQPGGDLVWLASRFWRGSASVCFARRKSNGQIAPAAIRDGALMVALP
jgi:hypothetical protein